MHESLPQSSTIQGAESPALAEYLEHVLKSEHFRKAPSLRNLLEYLFRATAEGKVDEIKESTIAIDVFGKSTEFDGRLDNIVRVQAHRLRKTLESYYAAEGSHDDFRISIPKGGYIPTFRPRDEASGLPRPPLSEAGLESRLPEASVIRPVAGGRMHVRLWVALAGAFLAGVLLTVVALVWAAPGLVSSRRADDAGKPPLSTFWGSLLRPGANCLVSFTNPVFLRTRPVRNRVYILYQGPLSAPAGTPVDIAAGDPYIDPELVKPGREFFFSDSWTGTGEVVSVFRLTNLFAGAGHPLKVVRSRALTYADLRDTNVVFLGSPWANELQDKVNPGPTPLVCLGTGRITNSEPRPGEDASYQSGYDAQTKALNISYALISVLPGVTPGTKIVSSAGVDTYGTSAGIDFLTSPAGVTELIQRLEPKQRRKLPEFFQAVVRAEIVRGDPARITLVLARELERKGPARPATR